MPAREASAFAVRLAAKASVRAIANTGSADAPPKTVGNNIGESTSTGSGSDPPKASAADDGQSASANIAPRANVPCVSPDANRARRHANQPEVGNDGKGTRPNGIAPTMMSIGPTRTPIRFRKAYENQGAEATPATSAATMATYAAARPSTTARR